MKIIRRNSIGDAQFLASSVAETDYPAYNAGTTYASGDRVIVTTGVHKVYESMQANNLNKYPPSNLTGSPVWWQEVRATNRWLPFDSKVGSQVSGASPLTYSLRPGVIDSIAFLNVSGSSIQVTLTDDNDGVVYSETVDLISSSGVYDGYTYCFEDIVTIKDCVLFNIPPYSTAQLDIAIVAVGGTAGCGEIVVGQQKYLGFTQYDAQLGIIDYSRKQADSFGNYVVSERAYSRRLNCEVVLPNSRFDEIFDNLAQYRATPLVWVGTAEYASMIVFGFYKSFNMILPGPDMGRCNLEIEGLT